jgi:hypothetical protein
MTKLRARFSRNSPPTAATDLTGKTALTWMVRKADMPTKLTTEIITAAILGFEEQKRHIDTKIAELRAMLSGGPAESAARPEGTPRKHKISAAARRRMAIAQRKRWAKIRGESEPLAPAKAPKAKRRISEEGMKRIIAATKKRWRLQKAAAKAPAKKAVTKKTAVKKAAVKVAPTKAAKKAAPAKKAAVKKAAVKAAPAAAQAVTEPAAQ